jgi:TolB-like protein/Tfp pilus assembly protein PilF
MLRAAEGNIEGGIAAAERLVRFDPLREDGHRVLIQLLVAAGRRSAALAQYKRCVEILRRDLGAEPEPETARLGEHIALGRMPPANAAAPERFGLAGAPSGQDSQNEVAQKTPILVLGFSDLSGDPDQNYFAQGIAQDITIALGRIPWLLVIGGSSAASGGEGFAGIQDIAHKLNVRYVLRGSIRRSRLRVRIVVQILDATNGGQLWSHGFDGGLSDIFDIQDRVATQAAAMIAPRLSSLEIDRAERKPTGSLGAYDFYLRAAPKFRKSAAENEQALRLLRRAVDLDRSYATAYALAARCYHFQKVMGWVDPADPALQEGVRLARLAEEYGGDDSEALWMAGLALVFLAGELDHGGRLIEKSLLLNPNSSNAWIASCFAQTFLGNCAAAMEDFVRAQQLNPLDTSQHVRWNAVGNIHFIVGRYDEAADISNKTLSENPTYPPGLRMKIAACGLLRRQDEARDAVRRLLQVNPSASVAMLRAFWEPLLCRSPGALDRYLEGLQLAGLPHA